MYVDILSSYPEKSLADRLQLALRWHLTSYAQ